MFFSKYDSLEVGPLLRHRFNKSHTAHTQVYKPWQLFEELVFFYKFCQTYLIDIVKGEKKGLILLHGCYLALSVGGTKGEGEELRMCCSGNECECL